MVRLTDSAHKNVSKYSLGMKQRLGIARAFLNNPNIVILDEPTNGLDPQGIKDIRELIQDLSKNTM
ncbi:ATP-binding cassette domain-containing protein [Clostridium botulinum]|nr:ATP-binding cassette domain-containing protein [Clostridium botulinum]MCS4471482.1 ATP-binding cassette domain-containing protein [Clostridium botulinum]MCS4472847.1 ATP-binding cassette domain-containing protein [Clostridium botulinum]